MFYDWMIVEQIEIEAAIDNFWKSIGILITKSFALNRNIGGCKLFNLGSYSAEKVQDIELQIGKLLNYNLGDYSKIQQFLEVKLSLKSICAKSAFMNLCSPRKTSVLFLRLTFPRNAVFRRDIFDLIYCDFLSSAVTFVKLNTTIEKPHLLVNLPHLIKYNRGALNLFVPNCKENEENVNFLKCSVLPKLSTWMNSNLKSDQVYSLNLVNVDDYILLYNELKKKYFNSIKEIWTENTNIEKFIHEDIGIATYLILLWGRKPQNFLDLGCGNGLLVYILNNEGHKGMGIDIRPRKIWAKYPSNAVLRAMTIVPSDNMLFPDADWIIGNHSDELTPWIPVIAFRSSYRTNFFLLPCCAYEFDGRKYSRSNASKSQYLSYMEYVDSICKKCGFVTFQDRLRIPSTKRLCFVSFGRSYEETEQIKVEEQLMKLIHAQSLLNPDESGKWLNNYKPRDAKEKVCNCTQLNKNLIDNIVSHVSKLLLKDSVATWNEGASMNLSCIVESVPSELLCQLKNECGGLQTVLRNHHHIFLLEKGKVKFRKPVEKKVNKDNWKKKACWFFENHPDSCPLSNEKCSYKHERASESFNREK